jgi:hypothetical protein
MPCGSRRCSTTAQSIPRKPSIHRKRDTDGSAADDDDLMPFFHREVGARK